MITGGVAGGIGLLALLAGAGLKANVDSSSDDDDCGEPCAGIQFEGDGLLVFGGLNLVVGVVLLAVGVSLSKRASPRMTRTTQGTRTTGLEFQF